MIENNNLLHQTSSWTSSQHVSSGSLANVVGNPILLYWKTSKPVPKQSQRKVKLGSNPKTYCPRIVRWPSPWRVNREENYFHCVCLLWEMSFDSISNCLHLRKRLHATLGIHTSMITLFTLHQKHVLLYALHWQHYYITLKARCKLVTWLWNQHWHYFHYTKTIMWHFSHYTKRLTCIVHTALRALVACVLLHLATICMICNASKALSALF